MRGRPPVPAEIRATQGGAVSHRPPPEVVQVAEKVAALPAAPSTLSPRAVEVWEELGPVLIESRLLDEANLVTFEGLCSAVGLAREAQADIDKFGIIVTRYDSDGRVLSRAKNPAVLILRDAWAAALRFAVEFGLTPAAKVRLGLGIVKGRTLQQELASKLND
jgi:P27 family predicted phage terminase small subunit